MPANGSVGTVTVSPRFVSQVRALLERERFDVLHFHEPFVPFLSLVILRESQSVNVGTFHAYGGWSPAYEFGSRALKGYAERLHGRIAVSAAARHFIDRYFPGDYKVHPQRRRPRPLPAGRAAVALAGRDAERAVRRAVRAPQGRPRHPQGAPDHAPRRPRVPAAARRRRPAGARGAAVRRHPPAGRRRVPGPRLRRRSATSCSRPRTSTSRRRPAASRSGSCCWRRWPPARRSSPRTSTATRASSGAAARRCSCRRGTRRSSPRRSSRLLTDRDLAAEMSANGLRRAEEFSWPRVTAKVDDYYGFVIRRLAAGGPAAAPTSRRRSRRRPGPRGARGRHRAPAPSPSRSSPARPSRSRRPCRRPRRPAAAGRVLGVRDPPDPRGVRDDAAGDDEEHEQDPEPDVGEHRRARARSCSRRTGTRRCRSAGCPGTR